MSATFYFDPACPWTWLTSRWLVQQAQRQGFDITWRSFSLAHVNRDKDRPEEYRGPTEAAKAAHRMFETLRANGANETVGRFYEGLGRRSHSQEESLSLDIVRLVAKEHDLPADVVAAADDESLDAAVIAQTEEAVALCHGDAGSPVLSVREGHGFNGPIIDAVPSLDRGQRLWEAVISLAGVSAFFEIKRARSGPPQTMGT